MDTNTTWTYNGHEFYLDMDNLDDLERYDKAQNEQRTYLARQTSLTSEVRPLISYCGGIRVLFDTLFGEGTAEKLLGDSRKPTDYDAVYESFNDFLYAQMHENAVRRDKMLNKYKPNREQRRILDKAK